MPHDVLTVVCLRNEMLACQFIWMSFAVVVVVEVRDVPRSLTVSLLPAYTQAVPAYLFVEKFIPLVSIGLGFAAGAMLFVTFHVRAYVRVLHLR